MKKALLVGINKYSSSPLKGCVNDVVSWRNILMTIGKFTNDDIRLLCDERATTNEICKRMDWLSAGTKAGDEILFIYSGHGTQIKDRNGDERLSDGLDECLCPVDIFADWNNNIIIDDDIGKWLCAFPKDVKITVVFDCCHSGTGTRDLRPLEENGVAARSSRSKPINFINAIRYLEPPIDILMRNADENGDPIVNKSVKVGMGNIKTRKDNSVVIDMNHVLISGCSANQTSADACIGGKYAGALTYYLTNAIIKNQHLSLTNLIKLTQDGLSKGGYSQAPQLEGPNSLLKGQFFRG